MRKKTLLTLSFIFMCEGANVTNGWFSQSAQIRSHHRRPCLDQDSDVISAPVIHNTIFVSGRDGSDDNDGLSLETPVASLKWAASLAVSGTRIWVMAGEYRCVW